jgi:hypothetical protein
MKLTKKTKGNRKTMKLLAEFLQEKFGKEKTEISFTVKEYMDYANVTDKNEEEVFQQLTEQIKRLLNYTCTLETIEKDGSFIEFNIVGAVMYLNSKFAIKITDETTIIRAFNKNWLVDYVTKGDE